MEDEDGHARSGPPPHRPAVEVRPVRTWRGWGPVAPVPRTRPAALCAPPGPAPELTLDRAVDAATRAALRPGPPGTVGLELEAHLVDLAVPGRRVTWPRIRAVVDSLGALPGGSRVTVEPGGQVELSGPPLPGVAAAVAALRADRAVLADALSDAGLALAMAGADPLRPPGRVNPAPRYAAMAEHFAAVGCAAAGLAMMTTTASLQVNLEAGPAAGWPDRVALAHQLGPVLVAISGCSPMLEGRSTGWRSSRQRIWGELDQARCGPLLGSG